MLGKTCRYCTPSEFILAHQPEFEDEPTAWQYMECVYEDETTGALCEAHVRTHPHEDYGEPLPVVNSPRMGMCGYTGPAEPPYEWQN